LVFSRLDQSKNEDARTLQVTLAKASASLSAVSAQAAPHIFLSFLTVNHTGRTPYHLRCSRKECPQIARVADVQESYTPRVLYAGL
jgi:hypothetical protein